MSDRPPRAIADLRGLSRLVVTGVLGVTDVVDRMHHEVARGTRLVRATRDGRTAGLTGGVYATVRGVTRLTGGVAEIALDLAAAADRRATRARVPSGPESTAPDADRLAFRAVLNGLVGDHLADSGNPLAIPMTLRRAGHAIDVDDAVAMRELASSGRRLVVLVHGLCMHDGQWQRQGHDHGRELSRDLGAVALQLRYNTGRHVSENGRELAVLLERLAASWPGGIDELSIVGHSMGGLVARSACHHAEGAGHRWLAHLRALACLGTPHHGTVLERTGHLATRALDLSRHAAPLARLARARSAGITDLRFGNVQDEDWRRRDRHAESRDARPPTPLPAGVDVYLLAATRAPRRAPLHDRLVGDGLVPLPSALGDHPDPTLALHVPDARRCVVPSAGHWDLLHRPEAYAQLRRWLGRPPHGRAR